MKKYGIYNIKVSTRKHKKYDVFIKDKYLLSFGDNRYGQYKDKIGHYSSKDSLDLKKLNAYYKRHNKKYPIHSADWFSKKFLW